MKEPYLLEARALTKDFAQSNGRAALRAVDSVSLSLGRGEVLGLAGESGCGKTTLARTLLGLYRPTAGTVLFGGAELPLGRERAMRPYRRRMQMTFQDPKAALDPRMTARQAVGEALDLHRPAYGRPQREERLDSLLARVGLGREHLGRYPHQLSGGELQRLNLARALAAEPELLVLDEPVSALDPPARARLLELLEGLRENRGLTLMLIAHDPALLGRLAHRVGVMLGGRLMELGDRREVMTRPIHPYTRLLLTGGTREPDRLQPMRTLGCPFCRRCALADGLCRTERPEWRAYGGERFAACHHHL